jgi:hypothetical protein
MAHSYLSVKKENTERILVVTDSILNLFMYFFDESVNKNELDVNQLEIYNHYVYELNQMNTSFIDLKLEEIFQDNKLCIWYIAVLSNLESSMEVYDDFIDNNYLNKITKLKKQYSRPIEVNKFRRLINDIGWLLYKDNRLPSNEFRWFEDSL